MIVSKYANLKTVLLKVGLSLCVVLYFMMPSILQNLYLYKLYGHSCFLDYANGGFLVATVLFLFVFTMGKFKKTSIYRISVLKSTC